VDVAQFGVNHVKYGVFVYVVMCLFIVLLLCALNE
jgi:hypothetical protein